MLQVFFGFILGVLAVLISLSRNPTVKNDAILLLTPNAIYSNGTHLIQLVDVAEVTVMTPTEPNFIQGEERIGIADKNEEGKLIESREEEKQWPVGLSGAGSYDLSYDPIPYEEPSTTQETPTIAAEIEMTAAPSITPAPFTKIVPQEEPIARPIARDEINRPKRSMMRPMPDDIFTRMQSQYGDNFLYMLALMFPTLFIGSYSVWSYIRRLTQLSGNTERLVKSMTYLVSKAEGLSMQQESLQRSLRDLNERNARDRYNFNHKFLDFKEKVYIRSRRLEERVLVDHIKLSSLITKRHEELFLSFVELNKDIRTEKLKVDSAEKYMKISFFVIDNLCDLLRIMNEFIANTLNFVDYFSRPIDNKEGPEGRKWREDLKISYDVLYVHVHDLNERLKAVRPQWVAELVYGHPSQTQAQPASVEASEVEELFISPARGSSISRDSASYTMAERDISDSDSSPGLDLLGEMD